VGALVGALVGPMVGGLGGGLEACQALLAFCNHLARLLYWPIHELDRWAILDVLNSRVW
jgi:hypothetical protein